MFFKFLRNLNSILLVCCLLYFVGYFPALAAEKNDELYFLHTDHLGSTTVVTDEAGEVVEQTRNYPYGSGRYPISDTRSPVTERSYTSQVNDASTHLYYYNARYYDPTLGTFTSADTANDGLNRFNYVDGNPVMATDPSGNRVLPPKSPWPWDSWVSRQRGRYYSSGYREFQLSNNPLYSVLENTPYVSSLGLLSSAGLEAATGNTEYAQDALAGVVAGLFPDNENSMALAMDIAGMSAVVSSPPSPWDGPGPGTDTIYIARSYFDDYIEEPFTGRYGRRPENFYRPQEIILENADALRSGGGSLNRQAVIDWASKGGVDVHQVPVGHPRLGYNALGKQYNGAAYIRSGMSDMQFLETLGHELGHEFDLKRGGFLGLKGSITSSLIESEARQTYWSHTFWSQMGKDELADHYWRRYQLLRGRRPPRR